MASVLLTRACNLSCTYCDQNWLPGYRNNRFMTPETWEATVIFLESLRDRPEGQVLNFFGGEPLLDKQLFINYISSHWNRLPPVIRVTTNGTTIDTELANFLIKHQIYVNLSHDGLDQITSRGRDPLVGKYAELLRKCTTQINYVVAKPSHFYSNVRYLWESGFNIVDDIDLYSSVKFSKEEYETYKRQYEIALLVSSSSCSTSDPLIFKSAVFQADCSTSFTCGWFRNAIAIDFDGQIYPCHRGPELPASEYSIGDVFSAQVDQYRLEKLRSLPAKYCVVRHIQRGLSPNSIEPDLHYTIVKQIQRRIKERNSEAVQQITRTFNNACTKEVPKNSRYSS